MFLLWHPARKNLALYWLTPRVRCIKKHLVRWDDLATTAMRKPCNDKFSGKTTTFSDSRIIQYIYLLVTSWHTKFWVHALFAVSHPNGSSMLKIPTQQKCFSKNAFCVIEQRFFVWPTLLLPGVVRWTCRLNLHVFVCCRDRPESIPGGLRHRRWRKKRSPVRRPETGTIRRCQ